MATGENLFSMQDGGHQMSLAIAAGLGLAAMSATPISSRPTAVSRTA
jgi:hypothetical protein